MSTFALVVHAAPYSSQASYSAYCFAKAIVSQGHKLVRIFFYQDGVHNASLLTSPPQDEFDLNLAWQQFANDHQVELVVCIAAALRRGVLNAEESQRYQKSASNLAPEFTLGGLGLLVEAAVSADRLINFGP